MQKIIWRLPAKGRLTFYNADFGPQKSNIGLENTYEWILFL